MKINNRFWILGKIKINKNNPKPKKSLNGQSPRLQTKTRRDLTENRL